MAVSKRLRMEILRRDNHTCRYCGQSAPDVPLTIDHVIPVSLGGSDKPENLVAACKDCNAGKAASQPDSPLIADVHQDALRWSAAMKLATENLAGRRQAMNAYCSEFYAAWNEYCNDSIYDPIEPEGFADSIESFYKAGLPLSELIRALHIAMSKRHIGRYDKFRYMAGIAWSVLTELQEETKAILERDNADGA